MKVTSFLYINKKFATMTSKFIVELLIDLLFADINILLLLKSV